MFFRIFLVSFVFICSFSTVSLANTPYMVKNIAVDVEGNNAIDAREKALKKARRNAYNVVLARLVKGGYTSSIPSANDNAISSLVDSFEINREKSSKNRYMASINVVFNERAIQGYIGRGSNIAIDNRAYGNNSQQYASNVNNAYSAQQANKTQGMDYVMQVELINVHQFISLKNKLRSIPNINELSLVSLSSSRAVLSVNYHGSVEQLSVGLSRSGMQLFANNVQSVNSAPYILVLRG